MDTYRAFLAIVISFLILIGYQYFFIGFGSDQPVPEEGAPPQVQTLPAADQTAAQQTAAQISTEKKTENKVAEVAVPEQEAGRPAEEVTVETNLYTAVLTESGAAVKSFVLKDYRMELEEESPGMQLVNTDEKEGLPMRFSWGSIAGDRQLYSRDRAQVDFADGKGELTFGASTGGVAISRNYVFHEDSFLIDLQVHVKNQSGQVLQGAAVLHQANRPFQTITAASRFLFSGPAAYVNGSLEEFKAKTRKEGPHVIQGPMDWAAYEGTYFISGILPGEKENLLKMEGGGEDETAPVSMSLTGPLDTLQPGEEKLYSYRLYIGPKKLARLQEIGDNLDQAVNFGWFDVIAKPTLWLLNFFNSFFNNYGIAIILVTILFKVAFWPITQKGLKSMKNMQKLQPKMVKLKEKYKSDPAKMNQEVMNLYKTYKVNPLGGCLPMVLQIPIFFALYKVLLQCIELRHAPFMLWINDLSAPDRLWIGFDLPYLGGIPVLTLLMGGSMFLQQKMTPTTADPTQAKIMMFLPVVFTFMFLNFASGLVLYWFINNLLAILQQQMINRQKKA
ncbi:MAG: membrane protein insertase YidC [Thermodesulfobacteriota bacterium]